MSPPPPPPAAMTATVGQTSCTPLQSRLRAARTLYAKVFSEEIWPAIRRDFDELSKQVPTTLLHSHLQGGQKRKSDKAATAEGGGKKRKVASGSGDDDDGDTRVGLVSEYEQVVYDEMNDIVKTTCGEQKEKRGVRMNLCWTDPNPSQNTPFVPDISYSKVAHEVLELFVDQNALAAQSCTPEPTAASAEEGARVSQPKRSVQEILLAGGPLPWKIPTSMCGFAVPIAIETTGVLPELGNFKRLSLDIVVNAVWLAYHWAKQDNADQAVRALRALILDWPFDFFSIEGDTELEVEESMFVWYARRAAPRERLRALLGLVTDEGKL